MHVQNISITKLETNKGQVEGLPKNPRLIKDEKFKQLVQSIKDDPEMLNLRECIVYPFEKKFVVIGGNMRLEACKELKHTDIPCKVLEKDTPVSKLRAYAIKDNVAYGENDWDLLANDWDMNELMEWGMDIPDFINKKEAHEDDYVIPDEIETDIVLGDLFEIGQHRLLCGDSTQQSDLSRLFGQELADLVITDPPYNVDYQGGDRTEMKARRRRVDGLKIQNDKMSDDAFYSFLLAFYSALAEFTKQGGVWYVWHADMETVNFRSAMIESGLTPKQCLIWKKGHMVMGRQDYHWQHEPCIYGWKEGAAHGWYSDRKQTTILEFDRPTKSKEHPTMKPVPLIAYQINNSSKQGDIVADSFLGSGTTMVAAHQLNRKCYGMEIEPKYCQVIIDRMKKLDPNIEIKKNGEIDVKTTNNAGR